MCNIEMPEKKCRLRTCRGKAAHGWGKKLRPGLLQRNDSVSLPGTAGEAKRSPVVSGENAAGIFPCCAAELELLCKAERASYRCARRISHLHGAGFSREPRPVPLSEQSGRAGGSVHVANALQARTSAAGPKSRRARRIAADALFEIREEHSRPAGPDARGSRPRSPQGHRRHHGESLAP